jgi:hypothetical protein
VGNTRGREVHAHSHKACLSIIPVCPCPEHAQPVDQGHVEGEDRGAQRARQCCDSGRVSIILVMGALAASGERLEDVDAGPGDLVALHS